MTKDEETAWRAQLELCTEPAAIDKLHNHIFGLLPTDAPGSSFRLSMLKAAVSVRKKRMWEEFLSNTVGDYYLTYGGRQS